MDEHVEKLAERLHNRVDRRDLIKKALTIGGAAYVAPMILSSSVPVSAQTVTPPPNPNPECVGATCATFSQFPCSSNPDCVCVTLFNGGGLCVPGSTSCASLTACGDGGACPDGQLCAINTCCTGSVCVPVSLTCPPSGNAGITRSTSTAPAGSTIGR